MTDESNILACSAAKAMAGVGRPRFNPLFIHGGTGQGKTHLLHAIAKAYGEELGAAASAGAIVYMSAERFMMEFVAAIRANDTMAFKARLRASRMLLIDDIQFIAGKGRRRRNSCTRSTTSSIPAPASPLPPTGRPSNWVPSTHASFRVWPAAWWLTSSPRAWTCGSRSCARARSWSSRSWCPRM